MVSRRSKRSAKPQREVKDEQKSRPVDDMTEEPITDNGDDADVSQRRDTIAVGPTTRLIRKKSRIADGLDDDELSRNEQLSSRTQRRGTVAYPATPGRRSSRKKSNLAVELVADEPSTSDALSFSPAYTIYSLSPRDAVLPSRASESEPKYEFEFGDDSSAMIDGLSSGTVDPRVLVRHADPRQTSPMVDSPVTNVGQEETQQTSTPSKRGKARETHQELGSRQYFATDDPTLLTEMGAQSMPRSVHPPLDVDQDDDQQPQSSTMAPPASPNQAASMLWQMRPSSQARPVKSQLTDPSIYCRLIPAAVILFRYGRGDESREVAQLTVDLVGKEIWDSELPTYMHAAPLSDDRESVGPLLQQAAIIVGYEDEVASQEIWDLMGRIQAAGWSGS